MNILSNSHSEYIECNSPIWSVKKADGKTWQLTLDYGLNRMAPHLAPVVAKFQDVMITIPAGTQRVSVFDLANAFFSIPVDERDQHKLAFTFADQQVTFKRLPQGLHNAPSLCPQDVERSEEQTIHCVLCR